MTWRATLCRRTPPAAAVATPAFALYSLSLPYRRLYALPVTVTILTRCCWRCPRPLRSARRLSDIVLRATFCRHRATPCPDATFLVPCGARALFTMAAHLLLLLRACCYRLARLPRVNNITVPSIPSAPCCRRRVFSRCCHFCLLRTIFGLRCCLPLSAQRTYSHTRVCDHACLPQHAHLAYSRRCISRHRRAPLPATAHAALEHACHAVIRGFRCGILASWMVRL